MELLVTVGIAILTLAFFYFLKLNDKAKGGS